MGIVGKWAGRINCAAHKKAHRFTIGSVGFYLVFSPVTFSFTTSPERSEGMHLSRPFLLPVCLCQALPMSLLLLAGLAGCGPAPSDNAPTLDPRSNQGEPPLSQKNPPPRTDPFASAASSATASLVPLASENRTGSLPARGTVPVGDSSKAALASSTKPANPMDALVIPKWIAKDLNSPDVDTRLQALETWVLFAPAGSIDPLILAFGNDDDRVRARAMELIEQDWTRAGEAGQ